jgi:hypothetical protein
MGRARRAFLGLLAERQVATLAVDLEELADQRQGLVRPLGLGRDAAPEVSTKMKPASDLDDIARHVELVEHRRGIREHVPLEPLEQALDGFARVLARGPEDDVVAVGEQHEHVPVDVLTGGPHGRARGVGGDAERVRSGVIEHRVGDAIEHRVGGLEPIALRRARDDEALARGDLLLAVQRKEVVVLGHDVPPDGAGVRHEVWPHAERQRRDEDLGGVALLLGELRQEDRLVTHELKNDVRGRPVGQTRAQVLADDLVPLWVSEHLVGVDDDGLDRKVAGVELAAAVR